MDNAILRVFTKNDSPCEKKRREGGERGLHRLIPCVLLHLWASCSDGAKRRRKEKHELVIIDIPWYIVFRNKGHLSIVVKRVAFAARHVPLSYLQPWRGIPTQWWGRIFVVAYLVLPPERPNMAMTLHWLIVTDNGRLCGFAGQGIMFPKIETKKSLS